MAETTYIITKREKCPECVKGFVNLTPEMREAIERGDSNIPIQIGHNDPLPNYRCAWCNGRGYIETPCDLLDALIELEILDTLFIPDTSSLPQVGRELLSDVPKPPFEASRIKNIESNVTIKESAD